MKGNNQTKKLNVVICQTHPQLLKKTQNIARFDTHLQNLKPEDNIDLLIFPEMSFTGYNFENAEAVMPMAVRYGEGEEFEYAKNLALRLKAYVLFGYVQKVHKEGEQEVQLYNSAALCDRKGNFIFNTKKTHLYYADEFWCKEGPGFKYIEISNNKNQKFRCAVGICMDLNPKQFTSGKYEFADFVKEKDCEVILFPTNWIDHDHEGQESSLEILNYWFNRLRPLLAPESTKMRYLVTANRVGKEYTFHEKKDQWFIGTSSVLSLNPNKLLGQYMDKKIQAFMRVEIALPKL